MKSESSLHLKGKTISVNEARYHNSKIVTKEELIQAAKNSRENSRYELEKMGTVFSDGQKKPKINETVNKGTNPIELE